MKHFKKTICLTLTAVCLQACVPLVIGGAAAATAALVIINDHRSSPTKKADKKLQTLITNKIQSMSELHEQCHILVTVFQGGVLLTGQAPTLALKQKAQNIAASVHGIIRLYDQIEIAAPNSELNRVSDYWITTKINTLLLRDKSLNTAQIEVLTENGTVYLLGTATQVQINTIIQKVRGISGVQKIVKMLNYKPASIS